MFAKLTTTNRKLYINTASGIINCGCQKTQNRSLLGSYQNKFCTIASTTNAPPKKKKTVPIPKVTLIQDGEVLITSLEDAQKLSKRRNLKLVKMIDIDTKTERPVYKLMTPHEYNAEDLKQRERKKKDKENKTIKGEKILMVGQNISEHDLNTQINRIVKWLARSYEVKVVINGDSSMTKAESVFNTIEKDVGTLGRIVQKRQKASDIKFQILPPKKLKSDLESDSTDSATASGDSNKPKND